jgi:hypothetical protein
MSDTQTKTVFNPASIDGYAPANNPTLVNQTILTKLTRNTPAISADPSVKQSLAPMPAVQISLPSDQPNTPQNPKPKFETRLRPIVSILTITPNSPFFQKVPANIFGNCSRKSGELRDSGRDLGNIAEFQAGCTVPCGPLWLR